MKQCPQCQSTYDDVALKFCGRDGSPLVDLSHAVGGFASLPISPSEIVLLFGEQFARPNGNLALKIPISGALVDARQLTLMMLTATVLSCEQAGSIRLEENRCLMVSAGSLRRVRWQPSSLEDQLCRMVGPGQNLQLPPVVAGLWGKDFKRQTGEAWIHARRLALQGLAARNLVTHSPDFSSVGVAPALSNLPDEETIEPLKNLFNEVSRQRSSIWAALQRDIELGVQQRSRRGGMTLDL